MGESKRKVQRTKREGDHSPGRTLTIDFSGVVAPVEAVETAKNLQGTYLSTEQKKAESEADTAPFLTKRERLQRREDEHKMRVGIEERPEDRPLTNKQEKFCTYYVELNNGYQAAVKAGYSETSALMIASENLRKPNIARRIKEIRQQAMAPSIATSEQVMQFFSDVMNGKIKDQFGLEASLSDRTRAAIELAKRTVDLDQKLAGKADATIEIKLDWSRD